MKTTKKDYRHLGFLGVDGEGSKDDTGMETYWLLRCGNRQIVADCGERLTTAQCLEFLFDCREPGKFLVGFALNYDWDHILRDLTDEKFTATRKEKNGAWFYTPQWRYLIKRAKCKFVEIRRFPREGGKQERLLVFDVFSFFQCSFVKAIQTWKIGTQEEQVLIERMKGLRGDFASLNRDDISAYNALECDLIDRLMSRFDEVVTEAIGIRLSSWHGPGALAKAALKKFGIAEGIKDWQEKGLPSEFRDAACRAFFGGWFQAFKVGHFDECYQVDINSAYPDQTRNLPALGGTVHHTTNYDPDAYAVWHIEWDIEVEHYVKPFPYRTKDGLIHRPPLGNGWYWQEEVKAAKEFHGDRIKVVEGWVYTPPTDELPFKDLVNALYETRLRLGKATEGIPIKLFLNSIYGVLAQSPIHGDKALGCVMWAGMITSDTRAKMLRAIMQDPDGAIYAATDGLLTDSLPDLPYSKTTLGGWDSEKYDSAQIYQPGIYRLNGAEPKEKVRGLRKDEPFDWEAAAVEWTANRCQGAFTVTTGERYLTRDLAIHFGHTPYHWRPETKTLNFHPGIGFENPIGYKGPKAPRETWERWDTWNLWEAKTYRTVPSAPYDKLAECTEAVREASALIRENYTEE